MKINKKSWAALATVAALGVAAAIAWSTSRSSTATPAKAPRAPVPLEFTERDLTRLTPVRLAADLGAPGTVQAVSQATVRAKLSAEVRHVRVREGERVVPGQVLAEFDAAAIRAQLAERNAALESARAQLAQSERTRATSAQLVKQNFVSQNAFDTADAGYRAQRAAVDAAAAQRAQAELLLADTVVRAPIGGYVARRHVQPGEKVAFDAPLMMIVDLARLEVQTQVPVADVPQLAPGARAEVEIEGLPGRSFAARVDRINPSTEPGTRTIHVFVALEERDPALKSGMFARVRFRVGAEQPVPSLPLAAVQVDAGQSFVWALVDGKLTRRPVELGRRDERAQRVEIRGGLDAGVPVLASKFDNLREGRLATVTAGSAAAVADGTPAATAPRAN